MFDWIKKHKISFLIICFAVIFALLGIPFLINIFFKISIDMEIFKAEWTAGELLGYYGAVLSFLGTVVLGVLALYQNHIIKQEGDRQAALLEKRNRIENMPKFKIKYQGGNGWYSNLRLRLCNITENRATDITIDNIQLTEKDQEPQFIPPYSFNIAVLTSEYDFQLKNKPIKSDSAIITMHMSCKDKYEDTHKYIIEISTIKDQKIDCKIYEIHVSD